MNKKIFMFIILITSIFMPIFSFAEGFGLGDLNGYAGEGTGSIAVTKRMGLIFSFLKYIGIVVSVVVLIVIGLKYIFGSVDEKAEYKKSMMPYIYGAMFLFSGSFIPELIYKFVKYLF